MTSLGGGWFGELKSEQCLKGRETLATTIAIAMAPGSKPNDAHSSASDLATSASAGVHRRVAVDASG